MEKSLLHDDFVLFNQNLGRLKEKTYHLQREETSMQNSEEQKLITVREKSFFSKTEEIETEEENCEICKGEGHSGFSYVHIQNLCPADRKHIARLVEKLVECTQIKNRLEIDLAGVRAENEALITRYNLFSTRQEEEMNKIKFQLEEKIRQSNKFRLQTSHSLELLMDQVKAQEMEYLELAETVKDLLRRKLRLQNSIVERDDKIRLLERELIQMTKTDEDLKIERVISLEKIEKTHENGRKDN